MEGSRPSSGLQWWALRPGFLHVVQGSQSMAGQVAHITLVIGWPALSAVAITKSARSIIRA